MSEKQRLTPEQRRRRARRAAHTSWANTADRTARTTPATQAFLNRFERQIDPEGRLDPDARAQRVHHARTAYMLGLAEKSAQKRRNRKTDQREMSVGLDK